MTCRQLTPDVVDFARGALHDPEREIAVTRHLRVCQACATLAERQRAMSVALRRLAREQPSPRDPDGGLEKLLASFEARRPRPRRMTLGVGLALAASVLIVAGLSVGWNAGAPPAPDVATPAPAADGSFVILAGANALPRFESGKVIRIDIPESALAGLGLWPPPSHAGAIQADVLVGQDGLARAIRLVEPSR